jgi:hypothetical protein
MHERMKKLEMLSSTCYWNTKLVLTNQFFVQQPANQCVYGVCLRAMPFSMFGLKK